MPKNKMFFQLFVMVLTVIVGASSVEAQTPEKIKVIASFSILADIAREIGGDLTRVDSLVGPDADAHGFEPRPADIQKLMDADLILVNGLGFEGWMDRLVISVGAQSKIVVAAQDVIPLMGHHDEAHGPSQEGMSDPHAWQDVGNARLYARTIAMALIDRDPDHRLEYESNLARYDAALLALDQKIRAAIAAIPAERRKIVTSHEAFAYFEKAYGLEMIAPLGVAPEAQPSARDVAAIIAKIRTEHIPALCLETINDPRLIEQIAAETGAKIAGTLYSDTLSQKKGPAGTYIAMMETNIRTLSAALAP